MTKKELQDQIEVERQDFQEKEQELLSIIADNRKTTDIELIKRDIRIRELEIQIYRKTLMELTK